MKCYSCGNNVARKKYSYCPYCGKGLVMTTKESYLLTLADSAQANRMEKMLGVVMDNQKVTMDFIQSIAKGKSCSGSIKTIITCAKSGVRNG